MRLRLDTDGAAIVRGFLSDQEFGRTAEMAGNAFAFLDGGGGDTSLRETWILVGTIWLTNFEHCVAPELARDLVTLLSRGATRTLGLSHLVTEVSTSWRSRPASVGFNRFLPRDFSAPYGTVRPTP